MDGRYIKGHESSLGLLSAVQESGEKVAACGASHTWSGVGWGLLDAGMRVDDRLDLAMGWSSDIHLRGAIAVSVTVGVIRVIDTSRQVDLEILVRHGRGDTGCWSGGSTAARFSGNVCGVGGRVVWRQMLVTLASKIWNIGNRRNTTVSIHFVMLGRVVGADRD